MTNIELCLTLFAAFITTLGVFMLVFLIRIAKSLSIIVNYASQEAMAEQEKNTLFRHMATTVSSAILSSIGSDEKIPVEIDLNRLWSYTTDMLESALKEFELKEDYTSAAHIRNELFRRKSK